MAACAVATAPEQLGLFSTPTLCGYCLRALTRQPAGDYACGRCRPFLAEIGRGKSYDETLAEFAAFQRDAARSAACA